LSKPQRNRVGRLERGVTHGASRPSETARRQRPERRKVGGGFPVPLKAVAIGLAVLAIAAVIVYAVVQTTGTSKGDPAWLKAELDDNPNIPGVYVPPHPGADGVFDSGTNPNSDDRKHFNPGTVVPICTQDQIDTGNVSNPLCYTSNPPTSGPHSTTPQGFSNQVNPAPKENVLHSMEHGGVYIWYNTSDQAAIDLIKKVVNDNTAKGKFVGSTIYTGMEDETIAITSWTRIDKFPVSELTKDRLQHFIDENEKRFNPEGF
jgi:hypothetical protein